MSRKLTVILRTCGRVFAQHGTRYVDKTKPEIINVCVSSLIDSINRVKDHQIELFVLDDASPDECASDLIKIISQCKFPAIFVPIQNGSGNAYTMKQVYNIVETHCTDLWYHVEDDYLHFPSAIQDLIDSVDQFEANTEQMVAINPHDDIWRYNMNLYKSFILLGPYRHYRTVEHTTYTCLASKDVYNKYKKHFQDVVTLTEQGADWVEDKSINLVWRKDDVMLFSPIPSLALHIMDPSGKDPYIDFDALWNSVPELWRVDD
jgi:glycosyltransferase involved in cell wall biosynthesis